jgi:hypothetical protein
MRHAVDAKGFHQSSATARVMSATSALGQPALQRNIRPSLLVPKLPPRRARKIIHAAIRSPARAAR